MSTRVYMLLNVSDKNSTQVVETLRGQKGVLIADILAGPPDVVLMVEALDRQKLADAVIWAIKSVEDMIEKIRLLPTIMDSDISTSRRRRRVIKMNRIIG